MPPFKNLMDDQLDALTAFLQSQKAPEKHRQHTRFRRLGRISSRWWPMAKEHVRITHKPTGTLLAEGPLGWGITPFEGNYYISRRYLRTDGFKPNFIPGICPYKFLYVWMDLRLENGIRERSLGWLYWLPNPLFPFIAYRVALPGVHPALVIRRYARQLLARNRLDKHTPALEISL